MDDWGLAGRVVACVHDDTRNIVAANDPTRVSWQSLPCVADPLQLPINDGFAIDFHRVIAAKRDGIRSVICLKVNGTTMGCHCSAVRS